jgi:hypothetical protein
MPYPALGDDYVFSINPINKPELLEGAKAVYTLLVRLFLLNPGTYQSNPDMGIGLVKNYRYGTDEDMLKNKSAHIFQDLKRLVSILIEMKLKRFSISI